MRILLITRDFSGASLAHRLVREGHDLRALVHNDTYCRVLGGVVERVPDLASGLAWVGRVGLVLFDEVGFGALQDDLRARGYSVVGGSAGGDRLELDRHFAQGLFAAVGMKTVPSAHFAGPAEAAAFVRANGGRWVGPIEVAQEHKAFSPHGVGPNTCEMGTLLWYDDDESNRLFHETLALLAPHLREIGFRGDVAVNCIVTGEGAFPLEATARFGWPATQLRMELHESPWGELLKAVADGRDYPLRVHDGYGVVVLLAAPLGLRPERPARPPSRRHHGGGALAHPLRGGRDPHGS